MSLFKEIKFKPHPIGVGLSGHLFLPNGYGISVVRFKLPGDTRYGSYSDEKTWEVAILKGTPKNFEISYETEFTDGVLTYQTEEDIDRILRKLRRFCQNLAS
jgi:hypothetical protein